jgi:ectoine hydroxylase-related dioxygenase (phytanoyl-CoA dioxygenase family)
MDVVTRPLIPTAGLRRVLGEDERADYERDGAAVLRGMLAPEWVDALRAATDRLMAATDVPSMDFAAGNGPRFFTLTYAWRLDPVFRAWALSGPLVDLARQVMPEVSSLNFFFDQIFAREAGSSKVTPFHQDQPYLPLTGTQVLRMWVPLDIVSVDTGAVQYLKGSHRGPIYRARSFDEGNPVGERYRDADFEPLPDFAAQYDRHDWLVGECAPGDVILHHPRTVHGSTANVAKARRRAIATFYTGGTTRWDLHPGTGFHNAELMGHEPIPDLAPGAPIDCDLFPRVWTARNTGEPTNAGR